MKTSAKVVVVLVALILGVHNAIAGLESDAPDGVCCVSLEESTDQDNYSLASSAGHACHVSSHVVGFPCVSAILLPIASHAGEYAYNPALVSVDSLPPTPPPIA